MNPAVDDVTISFFARVAIKLIQYQWSYHACNTSRLLHVSIIILMEEKHNVRWRTFAFGTSLCVAKMAAESFLLILTHENIPGLLFCASVLVVLLLPWEMCSRWNKFKEEQLTFKHACFFLCPLLNGTWNTCQILYGLNSILAQNALAPKLQCSVKTKTKSTRLRGKNNNREVKIFRHRRKRSNKVHVWSRREILVFAGLRNRCLLFNHQKKNKTSIKYT